MKFYDISFMDVGDELRMELLSRESSTWVAVKLGANEIRGAINLHVRNGHEERLRAACKAFNAALTDTAEPKATSAEELRLQQLRDQHECFMGGYGDMVLD